MSQASRGSSFGSLILIAVAMVVVLGASSWWASSRWGARVVCADRVLDARSSHWRRARRVAAERRAGPGDGRRTRETVRSYVETLRRAKDDPRIESVLIMPTPFESPFWGKVQEIRDAVIDFKKSGKRISAYLEYAGEREYYLASAADRST